MNNLLRNLFESGAPQSAGTKLQLRAFELFTVVYTLLYTWEWAYYIRRLSDLVLPLGLANYVNVELFLGTDIPIYFAWIITFSTLIPFISKQWRWLYALAFLLFHLQYVTRFSQGEIPHSANLVGFSLLGLALGAIFIRDLNHSLPFAFGFLIFFAGLSYTSSALCKLAATGITWPDGHHLWLWMGEKSIDILSKTGEFQYNWLQQWALSNHLIATLILSFGLLTELSGVLLWWKKFRPYVITAVILMHLGIYFTMNIFFKTFTIELLIVGYPWNRVFNNQLKYLQSLFKPVATRWLLY